MSSEESISSPSPDVTLREMSSRARRDTSAGLRGRLLEEKEPQPLSEWVKAAAERLHQARLDQTLSGLAVEERLDEHVGAGDPDCATCGGLGFYVVHRPLGHVDFGRAVPCECYLHRERFKLAGIPNGAEYEGMSFDNIADHDGIAYGPVIEALKAMMEGRSEYCFVTIMGPSGLAKTHLAVGAVKHALSVGKAAT